MQPIILNTDQTECYDAAGKVIDCMGSAQDGEGSPTLEGVAGDRFINGEGGIEDRFTGLTWKAQAGDFPMTWHEAVAYVGALNTPDKADLLPWRLPERRELFSLISHANVNPALPEGHLFENIFNGYHWTRTPCARLQDQAWYIHLGGGKVYRGMKHGSYLVWPVSGPFYGSITDAARFADRDDAILDTTTGNMCYVVDRNMEKPLTWENAIQRVRQLNSVKTLGYDDWRLPNIRELESLVDESRHSPAVEAGFPMAGHAGAGYWSSTTSAYETRYAWVFYAQDGAVGVGFKPNADFNVIAVRNTEPQRLGTRRRG
jgi:hypothetical protein